MKAQTVYENLDFERGVDPKQAIGLGRSALLKQFSDEHSSDINNPYLFGRDLGDFTDLKIIEYYLDLIDNKDPFIEPDKSIPYTIGDGLFEIMIRLVDYSLGIGFFDPLAGLRGTQLADVQEHLKKIILRIYNHPEFDQDRYWKNLYWDFLRKRKFNLNKKYYTVLKPLFQHPEIFSKLTSNNKKKIKDILES